MKRLLLIGIGAIVVVGAILAYGIHRNGFSSFVLIDRHHDCPTLQSPVDITAVTAVLYPGQVRGGDYKPHGGFRFDGLENDAVIVRSPIDATLVAAGGQMTDADEPQYTLEFSTECGLDFELGHLLTLSPRFQAVFAMLPPLERGTIRTQAVRPRLSVTAGESIATAVGFTWEDGTPNTSFDFGIYERWISNDSSHDPNWRAQHQGTGQYEDAHGLCWLDLLPPAETANLKALPGGDEQAGTSSDYCR